MPAAMTYPLDQSSVEYRVLEEAHAKELKEREKLYQRHLEYYEGKMAKPLAPQSDGVDDNTLLPLVDQIADKTVAFLFGDGVEFDCGGDGEPSAQDETLAAIWTANRQEMLLGALGLDGALYGHCAVRVEPREGLPPRITAINPRHFSAFWDVSDVERVLWYRLQYQLPSGQGKRLDYVREAALGEGGAEDIWYEYRYAIQANGAHWELAQAPQQLDFCPLIDWQNLPRPHEYYGLDDVRATVALNDALNFAASNFARILKHYASPKTVGIGFEAEEVVATGVGGLLTVNKPRAEVDVFHLEMQSDLASTQAWIGLLERAIWQSARMLDPQSLKDRVGQLTNFGLRVLFTDALHKTATKRGLYGEGLEAVCKLALALSGEAPPERVVVQWPDPLPVNEAETTQALRQDLDVQAISLQTYREKRGYDQETEEERLADEQEGQEDIGTRLLRAFESGGGMPPGRPAQPNGQVTNAR